jgi:hypothetical protein
MLAINAGKLEARLGFFTQYTVNQVDFPYQLLLDITRYVLVILESDCGNLFGI